MSTSTRVAKNTGFLYAKMGVTMFISLYTTRLILNSLGASDFGIFNIVGGAIAMLGFLNGAMASATQRFMSFAEGAGEKNNEKIIFNVSIVLHLILSIVVGMALLIAGFIFFNGILNIPNDRIFAAEVVYGSLIISTMFTVMTVPYDAAMNAHENMKYYAIIGTFESLLKLFVAFVTVYTSHDKLIIYGILMAIIPLITLTIMRIYCHKHYDECIISPKRYWDKGMMKEMTSFAGWNFIGGATSIISGYGIGLVLNVFYGTIANAAQGIANQISGQLGALGSNIKMALNPVITKSEGAGEREILIKSTIVGTKVTFFVVTICFLPIMVDMDYVLKIWLKNPPMHAKEFCLLLLITNIFQNITLFIPQAIASVGKIKSYTIITSIINIMPIILTYIAFCYGARPSYLYMFMMICAILKSIADLYYGNKECAINISYFVHHVILRMILAFLMSYIISYFIKIEMTESFLRLILITITSFASYIILFFFVVFDRNERKALCNTTNQIIMHIFKKI